MKNDRIMQDNRHYQAAKIDGFWDFVTRDPGDYDGLHRLDPKAGGHQLWLGSGSNGCSICKAEVLS